MFAITPARMEKNFFARENQNLLRSLMLSIIHFRSIYDPMRVFTDGKGGKGLVSQIRHFREGNKSDRVRGWKFLEIVAISWLTEQECLRFWCWVWKWCNFKMDNRPVVDHFRWKPDNWGLFVYSLINGCRATINKK